MKHFFENKKRLLSMVVVFTMIISLCTGVSTPARVKAENTITIEEQPQDVTVTEGSTGSLSVVATTTATGGALTFQWYNCKDLNRTDAVEEKDETEAIFDIPEDLTAGEYYYYCEVGAEDTGAVLSDVAKVTVMEVYPVVLEEMYASNDDIYETLIINSETLNASTVWGSGDANFTMDADGGFFSSAKQSSGAFPNDGKIVTSDGVPYQLTWSGDRNIPYAANDSIRFKGVRSGSYVESAAVTMKISTFGVYDKVYVLGTAGGFSDKEKSLNFKVTLTYADGSKSETTYNLYDWYKDDDYLQSNGIGYKVFSRLNKNGTTIDKDYGTNGGPVVQSKQIECDETKVLKDITFQIADTPSSVANDQGIYAAIYAVTGMLKSGAPAQPVAAAQDVRGKSFTVAWSAVEGASSYVIDVSKYPTFQDANGEPSFVSGYLNKSVGGISTVIEDLEEETDYYCRVRSVSSGGAQSRSSESVHVKTTVEEVPEQPTYDDNYEPLIINSETLNASTVWGSGDVNFTMDADGGFFSSAKQSSGAFPNDGKIVTSDGVPYQLTWSGDRNIPYAANDSIRFKGVRSGSYVESAAVTMKISTFGVYDKVYVLGTAGGFSDKEKSLNFKVTLTYADGSKSETTYNLYDWYKDDDYLQSNGIGYKVFSRLNKNGTTIDQDYGTNGGPVVQSKQIECDETKVLKDITFQIADTPSSVANDQGIYAAIYAVTGMLKSGAPAQPVAAAQDVRGKSFTVAWSAVEGASSYVIDVSKYPTFQDANGEPSFVAGYLNKSVSGTSTVIEGLEEGTDYYCRVRSVSSSGAQSRSSETVSAKTTAPAQVIGATYTFKYVYDCQRSPAWPKLNGTVTLSGFRVPYVTASGQTTSSEGNWVIKHEGKFNAAIHTEKIGTTVSSVVDSIASTYGLSSLNDVDVYSLSKDGVHICYGVIAAIFDDSVLFVGTTLSNGAGYYLSISDLSASSSVTKQTMGDARNPVTPPGGGEQPTEITYKLTLNSTNLPDGNVSLYTYRVAPESDSGFENVESTSVNGATISMPKDGFARVYANVEFTVIAEGATISEMRDADEEGYFYELTDITANTTLVVNMIEVPEVHVHDWTGTWIITKEVTETEDGRKVKYCKEDCGQRKIVIIPAIGSETEVDDASIGSMEKAAEVVKGAPIEEATLNNKKQDLIGSNIFEDAERTAVKDGAAAWVWLEIDTTKEGQLSELEKEKVQTLAVELVGENPHIIYFDANLYKQFGMNEKQTISEPSIFIEITIKIPEDILNADETKERKYTILRLHGDAVSALNGEFNQEIGEFTFTTNKFSTYAIVYADAEHVHDWSEEWSRDENYHWHECIGTIATCGATEKDSYAPHDYLDDMDNSCNTCGYERNVSSEGGNGDDGGNDDGGNDDGGSDDGGSDDGGSDDGGSDDGGSDDGGSDDGGNDDGGSDDGGSDDGGSDDGGNDDGGSDDGGNDDGGSDDGGNDDGGNGDGGNDDGGNDDGGSDDGGNDDGGSDDGGSDDGGNDDGGNTGGGSDDSGSDDGGNDDGGNDDGGSDDGGSDDGGNTGGGSDDSGSDDGGNDDGGNDDGGSDDGGNDDGGSDDGGNTGGGSDDGGNGDSGNTGGGSDDSGSDDGGSGDSGNTGDGSDDSGSDDGGNDDGGNDDSGSGDSGSDDGGNGDGGNDDGGNDDGGSNDGGSDDGGSDDSGSNDGGSDDSGSGDSGSDDGGNNDGGNGDSGNTGDEGYYPPYVPVVTPTPVPTTPTPTVTPILGVVTLPTMEEIIVDKSGNEVTSLVQGMGTTNKIEIASITDQPGAVVTFVSTNTNVVEVDEEGNVTMKNSGMSEITITVGEGENIKQETIVVVVEEPPMYENDEEEAIKNIRLGTSWKDIPHVRTQTVGETVDINFWGVKNWQRENYEYYWSSSDETVAVIDNIGNVTALKPGVVSISLGLKNKATGNFLNVKSVDVVIPVDTKNKISLGTSKENTFESLVIQMNQRIDINFYGVKNWKKEDYEYYWSSSEPTIVWVDKMGKITPIQSGTAVITLTLVDKKTGYPLYVVPTTITVK